MTHTLRFGGKMTPFILSSTTVQSSRKAATQFQEVYFAEKTKEEIFFHRHIFSRCLGWTEGADEECLAKATALWAGCGLKYAGNGLLLCG